MDRVLMGMISGYLALAVSHWCSVARISRGPLRRFWCGNIITDWHYLLTNLLAPYLAVFLVAMLVRRVQARRRPFLPLLAWPLFLGTTAGLLCEAYSLRDSGLEFSVWWFPRLP